MADQAKKSVGQYVDWIGTYVEACLEDVNNMRRAQQEAAGAEGCAGQRGGGGGCCRPEQRFGCEALLFGHRHDNLLPEVVH